MSIVAQSNGALTLMSVTSLNSLASSGSVGWQSDLVDNTSIKALDYKLYVALSCANTAPANDKAVYVYACPATSGGTWGFTDGGTTTLANGTNGTYTIGSANNLKLLGVLNYNTAAQYIQGEFNVSNASGQSMPDGFSIIMINYTGAAIASAGNTVAYRPIAQTVI